MIKRRALEITLERLEKPNRPRPELEQYTTPADVAADMLWIVLSNGDIQGKRVVDLGCGNGILGIGAALLGASSVHCYDIDPRMVELCKQNAAAAGVNIIADSEDALMVNGEFDTTIQNPPFGAQNSGADRPFIRSAIRISKVAYSLHNAETIGFVMKFCEGLNADVSHIKNYKFKIPYMFKFHREKAEFVYVSLLRIVPRR